MPYFFGNNNSSPGSTITQKVRPPRQLLLFVRDLAMFTVLKTSLSKYMCGMWVPVQHSTTGEFLSVLQYFKISIHTCMHLTCQAGAAHQSEKYK